MRILLCILLLHLNPVLLLLKRKNFEPSINYPIGSTVNCNEITLIDEINHAVQKIPKGFNPALKIFPDRSIDDPAYMLPR